MATGADIITDVLGIYSDYNSASLSATDLQSANDEILRFARIYPDTSESLTLVAGQFYYALNANTIRIWAGTYFNSATDTQGTPLSETSLDSLDQDIPGWRSGPTSTPAWYADRGGEALIYPAPSVASSGGYPTVTLYVARRQTLTTGTTLPSLVRDTRAWSTWIAWQWARYYDKDNAETRRQEYNARLFDLIALSNGVTARMKPSIRQSAPIIYRA